MVTGGGKSSDNFITVRWGSGPSGSISVSAGNNSICTASVLLNVAVSNLSGSITTITDVTCNGSSDGSVTAAVASGTGQAPYDLFPRRRSISAGRDLYRNFYRKPYSQDQGCISMHI